MANNGQIEQNQLMIGMNIIGIDLNIISQFVNNDIIVIIRTILKIKL
jgi:hypothetical protein